MHTLSGQTPEETQLLNLIIPVVTHRTVPVQVLQEQETFKGLESVTLLAPFLKQMGKTAPREHITHVDWFAYTVHVKTRARRCSLMIGHVHDNML